MTGDETEFRSWLSDHKLLSDRTAEVYSAMVAYGTKRGDPLLAVRKARTKGSLRVAHASIRLWAEWTKDPRLERRVGCIAHARRHEVEERSQVQHVTEEERTKLLEVVRALEEPYQSLMVILVGSGYRLGPLLDLSREQADGAAHNEPVVFASEEVILASWTPSEELQVAFAVLGTYGTWERLQDFLGSSYAKAYTQLRILLRGCCRKAGLRNIKPGDLTMLGRAASKLDAEERVA